MSRQAQLAVWVLATTIQLDSKHAHIAITVCTFSLKLELVCHCVFNRHEIFT